MEQAGRRKTILLVIRWPVGGIRTFLRYFYNHFSSLQYNFIIVLPRLSEHEAISHDLAPLNVTFFSLPASVKHFEFTKSILKVTANHAVDLIHSHGLTAGVYSSVAARLRGLPHLLTLHELFYSADFAGLLGKIKLKILSLVLSNIQMIHLVSEDAKDNILNLFPELIKASTKLVTIPHGVDVNQFSGNSKRDFNVELGLSEKYFFIGFLGRVMPVKGFRYLVEALVDVLQHADHLKKKPVLLVFGWGGYIREELESAKEQGVDGSIITLPFTRDVAATLRGLDVIVMPSLSEAAGLLAMEAMVSGVPVIGTDCPGLREVLRGSPNAVIPVKDSTALAQALIREINCPSRSKAEAYRKIAATRFSVEPQWLRLQNVYSGLIDAYPEGARKV